MKVINIRKHALIIFAILVAAFLLGSCGSGSTEPAEKVYVDESEIDAALSDGDSYKGKWITIAGKVFSVDKDGDNVALQAWYDAEIANQQFIVYASSDMAGSIKEEDFIKVDGEIRELRIRSDHSLCSNTVHQSNVDISCFYLFHSLGHGISS